MYYTTNDSTKFDVLRVKELLNQTSWAKDWTVEKIRTAMENSFLYGVFEKNTDNQVAFARVITDCATMWYLCDVVVDEQYRKKGVAKILVDFVVTDPRISKLQGMLITLDAHDLYKKFGFEINNDIYMSREGE